MPTLKYRTVQKSRQVGPGGLPSKTHNCVDASMVMCDRTATTAYLYNTVTVDWVQHCIMLKEARHPLNRYINNCASTVLKTEPTIVLYTVRTVRLKLVRNR